MPSILAVTLNGLCNIHVHPLLVVQQLYLYNGGVSPTVSKFSVTFADDPALQVFIVYNSLTLICLSSPKLKQSIDYIKVLSSSAEMTGGPII